MVYSAIFMAVSSGRGGSSLLGEGHDSSTGTILRNL